MSGRLAFHFWDTLYIFKQRVVRLFGKIAEKKCTTFIVLIIGYCTTEGNNFTKKKNGTRYLVEIEYDFISATWT